MKWSDIAKVEELSEPEYTHHSGVSSGIFAEI